MLIYVRIVGCFLHSDLKKFPKLIQPIVQKSFKKKIKNQK